MKSFTLILAIHSLLVCTIQHKTEAVFYFIFFSFLKSIAEDYVIRDLILTAGKFTFSLHD